MTNNNIIKGFLNQLQKKKKFMIVMISVHMINGTKLSPATNMTPLSKLQETHA